MAYAETKVIRKKKLDKQQLNIKISENDSSHRIFVEFSAPSVKLLLQKSFQNTYLGRKEAEEFENSLKTLDDLRNYFNAKLTKTGESV